ncbi:aldo/keto reductase [Fictibacillus iocasae]|uniref:Aldo/keto reductase n=1 Tax=Fictibacillus iocasae TaxID=2715437 RepID=A0ABW2NL32_9BACL
MEKRQIGSSTLQASVIGLGCMSLKPENEKKNEAIIEKAIELGVNYFDTADLYDFGANEEVVGRALKRRRGDIILATKGGNRWNDDKSTWRWDPSKVYIKEAVKASLMRLGTDYIDLYQLHGGTAEDQMDETIQAFNELVQEGVIRYYGISSIRPNVIRYYAEHSGIVCVMMQYSLLDRRPEELFPLLSAKKISVISRGSVAKGMLSEKLWDMDDEKTFLGYRAGYVKECMKGALKEIGPAKLNELALRFVLNEKTVACAAAGASSIEQLEQNASAGSMQLLKEETLAVLTALFPAQKYDEHR